VIPAPEVIGVVGAGTMGAGIAQLACLAGARTLLHDPVGEALDRGAEAVRTALARGAERGRYDLDEASAAADRLHPAPSL
jgi:3-hydroxybutyryl-CoA dehydrogenase